QGTAGQGTPQRGGVLKIAVLGLDTADPHRHTGSIAVQQVYVEALTSIADDGTVKPFLAERYSVSSDGTVYEFALRRGVRFHNGREVTAADVKANFERVRDVVKRGWLTSAMKLVRAVEAPDSRTFRVTLSVPYAPFLNLLSEMWILAPESPGWEATITRPIGTGPFRFGDWQPKTRLTAPAHPQYWMAGQPYLDAVEFDLRDAEDNSLALRAGDLHIASIPHDKAAALAAEGRIGIQHLKDTTWYFWSFNNRKPRPPFDDVRVRRAVTYALDKPAYMRFIAGAAGTVGNQLAAPGNFFWDRAMHDADPHAGPDLERARALLAEAGVEPRGRTVRIVSWQDSYTQIVVQAMRTLGFGVEHLALDDVGAQRRLGQYDWDLAPMSSGPRADIFLRYVRLMSDGPNPVLWGGVQDPELDRLIERAVSSPRAEDVRAAYLDAWQRVMDRYYTVVVGHAANAFGVRPEVRGYRTGFTWGQHSVDGGLAFAWLAGNRS
ncbi:MAG: ABC transporter substrate-binding protein, partial [Alphaproteobacteria bacterium]|nr:ABC transporter substrate-binding protein [Alphaproteobacteria bacterium]